MRFIVDASFLTIHDSDASTQRISFRPHYRHNGAARPRGSGEGSQRAARAGKGRSGGKKSRVRKEARVGGEGEGGARGGRRTGEEGFRAV